MMEVVEPEDPADSASIALPLTGTRVHLAEMKWEDPSPGLLHTVGGSRVITHRRRVFNEPWASMVYGIRPTPDPVTVWFSRIRGWRRLRKQAEVVYGPEGLWGAEAMGRWDAVEVSHAGQTQGTAISRVRLWELALPRPKARTGESRTPFGPGQGPTFE
jgi:hypothetical protein